MTGRTKFNNDKLPLMNEQWLNGSGLAKHIQDQLNADLTVSGIAQAVSMSPDHFAKLFKESTGQSPYRYVIEARVRKAKELLTTGNFTFSETAH